MEIDSSFRDQVIKNISKFLDEKISKDIELSIYNFSLEFAEINDTPYLIQQIYESKIDEIMCHLSIKQSFLVKAIKDKKIDPLKVAFMKQEELNPEKFETIIKKRELEEYKKNNKTGTNAFTCAKCQKSRCEVTQKQVRRGDEPPTTFVTCLECGHAFKFA